MVDKIKPNYYSCGMYEVIDLIEILKLNFNLGNALKYLIRAGKKDPNRFREDLKKAIFYLEREISNSLIDEFKISIKGMENEK